LVYRISSDASAAASKHKATTKQNGWRHVFHSTRILLDPVRLDSVVLI
jgi:hypothetical protein